MMARIDLDRLKKDAYDLFQIAARVSGQTSGVVDVDISGLKLMPTTRTRFAEWAVRNQPTKAEESAPPPAPVVEKPATPQIDFAETLRENEKDIQRRADEAAARNRLDQYAVEQGLEPSDHNVNLIKDFVTSSAAKGYWSAQIVDVAVATLRNRLTWKPKAEAPPPPPPAEEPPEVLGTLPDGTMQLPLNVDNFMLKRASKEQARDWLARANAGKIIRPPGSFISTF